MKRSITLENIEAMRRSLGIHDRELQEDVRNLQIGDLVRLTFLSAASSETLLVRITSVSGSDFRGKLAQDATLKELSTISRRKVIVFRSVHIHSTSRSSGKSPKRPAARDEL